MSNVFLISWDQEGVDCVVNLTKIDQDFVWASLQYAPNQDQKEPQSQLNSVYNSVLLRARFNSHRHPEVYVMNVEDGITESDVREMFERNPQYSADLVRERGTVLYSCRHDPDKAKIK